MTEISIFLGAAAVVILGIFVLILVTRKAARPLDKQRYQSRWMAVESRLVKDQPASYQLAILEADKLVDFALKDRGIRGKTMGERMKNAQGTWSNANRVWTAHKLRNQIAHETDMQVSFDTAGRALKAFREALKDLGAI